MLLIIFHHIYSLNKNIYAITACEVQLESEKLVCNWNLLVLLVLLVSGMSLDEYRAAVRSVSCKAEREITVEVEPSPTSLPQTTSGKFGYVIVARIY